MSSASLETTCAGKTQHGRGAARGSSSAAGTRKLVPLERCRGSLLEKLRILQGTGLLRHSLQPNNPASDFELLEFYGDSVLYERISFFVMQTRRFMSPHLLTVLRCASVNNKNLARCFDALGLASLLSEDNQPAMFKNKADVVEAIIGELAEVCARQSHSDSNVTQAKSVLDELLAYISYSGEEAYFVAIGQEQTAAAALGCCKPLPGTSPSVGSSKRITTVAVAKEISPAAPAPSSSAKRPAPAAIVACALNGTTPAGTHGRDRRATKAPLTLFSSSTPSALPGPKLAKPVKRRHIDVQQQHQPALRTVHQTSPSLSKPPLSRFGSNTDAAVPAACHDLTLLPACAYGPSPPPAAASSPALSIAQPMTLTTPVPNAGGLGRNVVEFWLSR